MPTISDSSKVPLPPNNSPTFQTPVANDRKITERSRVIRIYDTRTSGMSGAIRSVRPETTTLMSTMAPKPGRIAALGTPRESRCTAASRGSR